jgi:hypothetical protein
MVGAESRKVEIERNGDCEYDDHKRDLNERRDVIETQFGT